MSKNENLGQALDASGNDDQKSICTEKVLSLSKAQCSQLIAGHDAGLSRDDKSAFNKLIATRVNNVQSMLPWDDVKMDAEVPPNW